MIKTDFHSNKDFNFKGDRVVKDDIDVKVKLERKFCHTNNDEFVFTLNDDTANIKNGNNRRKILIMNLM